MAKDLAENTNSINPIKMILLFIAFIAFGIFAVFLGQALSRALTSIGITSHLTIWLVPGAPIFVVYVFYNIFRSYGLRI